MPSLPIGRIFGRSRPTDACRRSSRPSFRHRRSLLAEQLEDRRLLAAMPVISEILASNAGGLRDSDGDSSDWIEVYNPNNQAIDLAGFRLTDDDGEPSKWVFPSTTLNPSESIVVFASGKDRAIAGAELHTNFQLSSEGEYLALIDPSGVIASEYAGGFPEQTTNVSYGLHYVTETLVQSGSPAAFLVPEDPSLSNIWQQRVFDDSNWADGPVGIGYGVIEPGFDVRYVKAKSFDTFDGNVTTLAVAESVLANVNLQSLSVNERFGWINFLGTGAGGHFTGDAAFPTQSVGDDFNHFVIEANATISIPAAGAWSFGVNSDDGFGLTLSRNGVNYTTSFPNPRGASDTITTFTLPEPGEYQLRLVMFEAAGGASVELFAASGSHTSFSNVFDLVGDTGNGGLSAYASYVSGASAWVSTDVQSILSGINSSAYVRIPFDVSDPGLIESIALRMRFDDGFIASINGVEIARQNAPALIAFDSAASAARDPQDVLSPTDFVLNDAALAAIVPGTNILSVQGLNQSDSDASFLVYPELISTRLASVMPSYFSIPTPGALNQDPISGVLKRVAIDVPAGFYDTSQTVTIGSTNTVGQIVYTTDGSEPSLTNGNIYSGPLTISGTTTLRAIAVADGYLSLPSVTRTYLFLDDVLTQSSDGSPPPGWPAAWGSNVVDYGIDPDVIALEGAQRIKDALLALPTLSLTTDLDNLFDPTIGIYANAQQDGRDWERPTSAEWLNPDGSDGFQVNAGLRIRGGFSRSSNNPKHALKLFFRGSYGDSTLNYPVHGDEGVSEFSKLDLRTAQNYSWSFQGDASNNFVTEVMARYNQRDLDQPYTRSTWVHLYLNGQYWGMYQTQERAEAEYAASYFGGNPEDYDVLKPERGAYQIIATDGNFDAYTQLWEQAVARDADGITPAFVNDAEYMRAQGKNPDGTENLSYPVLLDVDNLIVYMIETLRGGNLDAPISNFLGNDQPNNYFAIRDRTGREGFRFFQHDAEHTMRNVNQDRNGPWNSPNYEGGVAYFNPQWLHQQLMANQEYRMRFADRVQDAFFHNGPLSESAMVAKIDAEVAKIQLAVIAESARWGDAKRGTNPPLTQANFLNAVATLRNGYLPARNPIVINQFRGTTLGLKDAQGAYNVIVPAPLFPSIDAPEFLIDGVLQYGGQIVPDSKLQFSAASGIVHFTIDGSDPRLVGGGLNPNAQPYDPIRHHQTLVASGQTWNYLDDGSQPPANWNSLAFDDSTWQSGASELGYGDGDEATVLSFGGDSGNKFLTAYFRKRFTADLSGDQVVAATVRVRRDDGVAIYLNGVEIVRNNLPTGALTATTTAVNVVGGAEESQWFEFSFDPSLLNDGVNVISAQVHQVSPTSSDLTFDAEVLISTQSAFNVVLADSTLIKARTFADGEWSALSEAFFQVFNVPASADHLRLTEINFDPAADGDAEYIELRNITSGANAVTIDLDGVTLTDGPNVPFSIPIGTRLSPGESVVLVSNVAAFTAAYPTVDPERILGPFAGRLSNGGERIRIVDAAGLEIVDVNYGDDDPWSKWADGVGGSLVLIDPINVTVAQSGKPYHYRESVEFGGTPATKEQSPFGIVINEVLAHTDPPLADAIELYNPTHQPIGIGGWYLSDDGSVPMKYKIPAGTTIAAGGYVVFTSADFDPPLPDGQSLIPFALNADRGDSVWLFTGDGTVATGLEDYARFDATYNGISLGLIEGSAGRLVPLANRSLGTLNGMFEISPVVISEIHYHPAPPSAATIAIDPFITEQDLEFIEIQNAAAITIDLNNWRLRGESDFDFTSGHSLAPGESLVIVSFDPNLVVNTNKLAAFGQQYGILPGVRVVGPFSGSLGNSHGLIKLQSPDEPPLDDPLLIPRITVDEVFFDDLSPWPIDADGAGGSLQRLAPSTLGNYYGSWVAESPTPGSVPGRPVVQSVAINGGAASRSSVSEITVTFDRQVDVSAASFVLTRRESGAAVTNLQINTQLASGKTIATITFGAGPLVISRSQGDNSLVDGNYQLTVVAANVFSVPDALVMAADVVFGNAASDAFFRLFGDSDGDRDVDGQDYGRFGLTFLRRSADFGFDPDFDVDGDGDVDGIDYGQFQVRMRKKLKH